MLGSEPASTAAGVQDYLHPHSLQCDTVQEEPYWEESTLFTRELALQREVEVEVETVDRGGTFLGTLRILDGTKRAPPDPGPSRLAHS